MITRISVNTLIRISRPRFWWYTAGPFLIGVAAAGIFNVLYNTHSGTDIGILMLYFGYFLFPANLLIYWVNDIADNDTDQYNAKKNTYEQRLPIRYAKRLKKYILHRNTRIHLLGVGILMLSIERFDIQEYSTHVATRYLMFLLFYFFSISYSALPIRAKRLPFLDGIRNVLYIIPGIIGYILPTWALALWDVQRTYVVAWILRAMAMHCYSAIPDIDPDQKAWITTTAVYLWTQKSLIYCTILWCTAAFLSYPTLGRLSITWAVVYGSIAIMSMRWRIFTFYKIFPRINMLFGMGIFFKVLLT